MDFLTMRLHLFSEASFLPSALRTKQNEVRRGR